MHSAGLTALFLSLFSGSPPRECPAVPLAAIEVSASLPGSTVDHGRSRRQIGAAMTKTPMSGFVMQGLTVLDFGTSFTMEVTLTRLGDGRWCAGLERVTAEFGLKNPAQVLVAREIAKGSCAYMAVLRHEMEHVAVGERNVRMGVADMKAALSALSADAFPIEAASREDAYRLAGAAIEDTVNAAAEAAIARAGRENAAMDTLDAYERLRDMCP